MPLGLCFPSLPALPRLFDLLKPGAFVSFPNYSKFEILLEILSFFTLHVVSLAFYSIVLTRGLVFIEG